MTQKTPIEIPNDYEAEQAVLGSIIYDNSTLTDVLDIIMPISFYTPAHQHIYRAVLELDSIKQPVDELTLGDQLKSLNQLDEVGGYAYLATLQDCFPSSGNIAYYAKIIQEHALKRQLISFGSDVSKKARDPEQNFIELISDADSKLQNIYLQKKTEGYTHIKDIFISNFEKLEEIAKENRDITGLATGFVDFDRLTSGLQNSDLIIIAARPSIGKSSLALNIAKYVATRSQDQGAVLIFSLEMSKYQIGMRLLCSEGKIDTSLLRNGKLNDHDWDKLAMATDILSTAPIFINDTPRISIDEIIAISKKLDKTEENGLSLVIVDYMQLSKVLRSNIIREQEIAEISSSLKGLAKDLDVPVIALSQLNRSLENRSDKRPMMADLRESGAIEQDADIIVFLYRDEFYNEDTPEPGIAEFNIAKHRNGPTGMIKLVFIGKHTQFANHTVRNPDD
jgi:replicative DNA helicase